MQMTGKIREEISNIKKRPMKIFFSAAVIILMLILTAFAWDGIIKRLIICLGLSFLSGILLLLPRFSNRISIPLLIIYLWYVPMKMFERMELPVHNMEKIADESALLTAAFIICAFLLIFLLTQNSAVALGAGSGFFLILFLVEYYVWKFRGDFLKPSDLKAAGTAVSVMGGYEYGLSPEALYTVIYFLFFIVLGSQIRIRMHKWVHVIVSIAAALYIGIWYYVVMDIPNPLGKEFEIDYWNVAETRAINGACMSYFLLWKDSKIDIPKDYSEENIQLIADTAAEEYDKEPWGSGEKPDIIMIMSEAWSDLRVLGELDTTEDFMPFVDELAEKDNTLKGNMYVSILGGYTANTEFEALTGNSLALLSSGVIPYQNQVEHDMPSLARVLENQGYETMSMHPSMDGAWNRKNVYAYFGFDDFIYVEKWGVPYEYEKGFISDKCNFDEIIYRYENRNEEAPFFLFDVTIQNHGGYYKDEVPITVDLVNIGGIPAEEAGELDDLETYLNLMKISDSSFQEFVHYFEQTDRPVIICLFGDHQPRLSQNFYEKILNGNELPEEEQNLQKYIVPYVVWANYDVDWEAYGNISANYMPAVLMECAGLELPPFYQYLMELHGEYPVLTQSGCLDKEGNLINIKEIWDTDLISGYRMLQYNQLYEKDYQSGIFVGEEKQSVRN